MTTEPVEALEGPSEAPVSPYDLPGDWYVIHSYSGYENKVKANLETRIRSMHMENRIFEVHIPLEDVVEIKGGKKVTVARKVFPGYILVRMQLDDDSWYAVRNTPAVTGFVGGNNKPTPLSRREVERFLGVQKEAEKIKGVKLYGLPSGSSKERVAVVSLNLEGKDPAEVGYELDEKYGIMTRVGLHCAPLAHRTIGTYPTGTVRFSFGYYNTEKEVEAAVKALKEMTK